MLNALQSYQFEENAVRVVLVQGEPWFVANDICGVLGIGNARQALERLDEDEKGVSLTDTLGGQQAMNIVSESGMYALVMGSRKAEARRFRRWVTGEVLPAIRKTGRYELFPPDPPALPSPAIEDADLGRLNAAIGIMREARQIWGREDCRTIWINIGLPSPIADAAATTSDAFADELARAIGDKERLTMAEICGLIGIPFDMRNSLRVGATMRLLGWHTRVERIEGVATKVWRRIPRVIHGVPATTDAGGEA